MKGYVKNISPMCVYAMKHSIKPNEEIPLRVLYKQYGKKHDLAPNEEFIEWLRAIKLRDGMKWKICYIKDGPAGEEEVNYKYSKNKDVEVTNVADVPDKNINTRLNTPLAKEMDVSDVVELSVRGARDILPKIVDKKLLKYALKEAEQRTGKDTLCILLRKRLNNLELL